MEFMNNFWFQMFIFFIKNVPWFSKTSLIKSLIHKIKEHKNF